MRTSADLPLRTVFECGVRFRTGTQVTFGFVRNTEGAPYCGATFQQDIEPAGIYMQHDCGFPRDLARGWIRGRVTMRSPLVLRLSAPGEAIYGPHSWKALLALAFQAKRSALSKKIIRAGYDGIVTVHKRATSEIVVFQAGRGFEEVFG